MSRINTLFFTLALAATLTGCSGSEPAAGGAGASPGGGGSSTANSPLEIRVRANYSKSSAKRTLVQCSVPAGTNPGDPEADGTCLLQVPELDMHYSDFEFRVSTNSANTCAQVVFIPFQYLRSLSTTFSSPDGDVDCSLAIKDPYCYGGAAKFLKPEFGYPGNTGLYFLTSNQLSGTYTLPSTDENRAKDGHRSMRTNINVANNFTDDRTTPINGVGAVDYVANTFIDYTFLCEDRWGETLYSWTLIMGDDDLIDTSTNMPFDSFYDWGN